MAVKMKNRYTNQEEIYMSKTTGISLNPVLFEFGKEIFMELKEILKKKMQRCNR